MIKIYLYVMLAVLLVQLVIDVVTPSGRPIVFTETRLRVGIGARVALLAWTVLILVAPVFGTNLLGS